MGLPETAQEEGDDALKKGLEDVFLYEARLALLVHNEDRPFPVGAKFATIEQIQGLPLLTPKPSARSRTNLDNAFQALAPRTWHPISWT